MPSQFSPGVLPVGYSPLGTALTAGLQGYDTEQANKRANQSQQLTEDVAAGNGTFTPRTNPGPDAFNPTADAGTPTQADGSSDPNAPGTALAAALAQDPDAGNRTQSQPGAMTPSPGAFSAAQLPQAGNTTQSGVQGNPTYAGTTVPPLHSAKMGEFDPVAGTFNGHAPPGPLGGMAAGAVASQMPMAASGTPGGPPGTPGNRQPTPGAQPAQAAQPAQPAGPGGGQPLAAGPNGGLARPFNLQDEGVPRTVNLKDGGMVATALTPTGRAVDRAGMQAQAQSLLWQMRDWDRRTQTVQVQNLRNSGKIDDDTARYMYQVMGIPGSAPGEIQARGDQSRQTLGQAGAQKSDQIAEQGGWKEDEIAETGKIRAALQRTLGNPNRPLTPLQQQSVRERGAMDYVAAAGGDVQRAIKMVTEAHDPYVTPFDIQAAAGKRQDKQAGQDLGVASRGLDSYNYDTPDAAAKGAKQLRTAVTGQGGGASGGGAPSVPLGTIDQENAAYQAAVTRAGGDQTKLQQLQQRHAQRLQQLNGSGQPSQ